jgi:hypothetical protein
MLIALRIGRDSGGAAASEPARRLIQVEAIGLQTATTMVANMGDSCPSELAQLCCAARKHALSALERRQRSVWILRDGVILKFNCVLNRNRELRMAGLRLSRRYCPNPLHPNQDLIS